MNDNESRREQTFVRVEDFGAAHLTDFAANSLGRQLFADLAAIIAEIRSRSATEVSGVGSARQGTTTRKQARAALREDLDAINRTARIMADDVPGLDDKFRVPRNNNDPQLLAAARAAALDAVPFAAQFIAHELPADFLEDLAAGIADLERAMSEQSGGIGDRVAAAAAIDDAIDRGIAIVRKLDAIVRNKYANNPAVLAEWTSASHTERAPRKKKDAEPPATPPDPTEKP